jgi:hypothetical protein
MADTIVVTFMTVMGEELGQVAASPEARVADLLFETNIPVLSRLLSVDGEVLPPETPVSELPPDPVVQVLLNKRGVFKARHHPEAFVIHPPTGKTIDDSVGHCFLVGRSDCLDPSRTASFYRSPKSGAVHAVLISNDVRSVVWDIAPTLAHLVRLLRAGCALIDAATAPRDLSNVSLFWFLQQTFVDHIKFPPRNEDHRRAKATFESLVNKDAAVNHK